MFDEVRSTIKCIFMMPSVIIVFRQVQPATLLITSNPPLFMVVGCLHSHPSINPLQTPPPIHMCMYAHTRTHKTNAHTLIYDKWHHLPPAANSTSMQKKAPHDSMNFLVIHASHFNLAGALRQWCGSRCGVGRGKEGGTSVVFHTHTDTQTPKHIHTHTHTCTYA
jgi:hypothetical protein